MDGVRLSPALAKVIGRVGTRPGPPEADLLAKELAERRRTWESLASVIGRRYRDCRIETFDLYDDPAIAAAQTAVLDKLRVYAGEVADRARRGQNVVLYGPCGSGKDHLLAGLMFEAVMAGVQVAWVNGMRLFERRRDAISADTRERSLLAEYERPHVLAISDPVPPWGELEKGQVELLLRILDERYRHQRPTWMTVNVTSKADGERRMSKHIWERLRDQGLGLDCNWPSYRTPLDVPTKGAP